MQGVDGFCPIPEHWSDNKGDAAGSNTLTFDVIEPTPPPDLRPHLSCDNEEPLPTDSTASPNEPPRMETCDSIDGADVEVTLTVTRPNGTTVSSLLYTVEWDVQWGVPPVMGSSHATSTTSRARHRLTWSSTGLTTGRSRSRGCSCATQWLRPGLQLHPGHHHREGEGSAAGGERDRLQLPGWHRRETTPPSAQQRSTLRADIGTLSISVSTHPIPTTTR